MEAGFRLLAEQSGDMVCRLAMDGRQLYVSPASERLLGLPALALTGRSILDQAVPEDRAPLRQALGRLLGREATEASVSYRALRADGGTLWLEASLAVLRAPQGGVPFGMVAMIRDITRHKAEAARLSALALRDELTGLTNRRGLRDSLAEEWQACAEAHQPLSLLLLDVDRFKAFNDLYGHPEGDACLRAVALTVAATVRRRRDQAGRWGGEEFLVLLPDTGLAEAEAVAERLRGAVEELGMPHGQGGVVTVSIGVAAVRPVLGLAAQDLLAAADRALYAAKGAGRNRVALALEGPTSPFPGRRRVAA